MNTNTLASSLTEIRARAAARFAADDGCVGISMMTFLGLVFVNANLEIIAHEDAVKRGLTDSLN
jgi:hypothetical protein